MHLFLHVFVIVGYIAQHQNIHGELTDDSGSSDDLKFSKSKEYFSENIAVKHGMKNHTFVALIDIVFTDGTKRTCTGTIIHDNVVITARHCFGKTHDKYVQPEISASFVVIGSKKMFEAGYEQYLPIERIISHPKYRGWTADIALVYTFAGMMSDKPGTILPLAGEKISIPKHSNITILSWGHYKDSYLESEKENDHNDWKKYTRYPVRANDREISSEEILLDTNKIKISKTTKLYTKINQKLKTNKTKRNKTKKHKERDENYSTEVSAVTEGIYRSQTSSDDNKDEGSLNTGYETDFSHKIVHDTQKHYGSIFKNWRRNMGSEKNELSVENFKFIDMQTCVEMMKKGLPDKYKIKNPNEYICYSSEDRFVTDEDAGAPAVRHGHLIAVTVGGVKCDDEQVAVGIKISCFCTWIVDNLPDGMHLKCCENCCDDDKPPLTDEDDKDETRLRTAKKKKIKS